MKKIKKVMLLIVVFMIAVILKGNIAFAEYVIQVVPNATAWNNITVSEAYNECQKLNTTSSTLGTTSLKAHLTTNADWYAVGLLTLSAYGNKNASNTTGNSTGVMNFSNSITSSVLEGSATNDNRKLLYDNINTPYVETISQNRNSNLPGRGLLPNEYISSAYGEAVYTYNTANPVVMRMGLLGFVVGAAHGSYAPTTGASRPENTFRPVIWNK